MAVCVRDDGLRSVTFCASTKRRLVRWGVPGRRRRVVRRRFVHREVSCIGKGWSLGDKNTPMPDGVRRERASYGLRTSWTRFGVPRTRRSWSAVRRSQPPGGPTFRARGGLVPRWRAREASSYGVPRTGSVFRARGHEFQAGTGPRAGVSGSSRTGRRSRSPPP